MTRARLACQALLPPDPETTRPPRPLRRRRPRGFSLLRAPPWFHGFSAPAETLRAILKRSAARLAPPPQNATTAQHLARGRRLAAAAVQRRGRPLVPGHSLPASGFAAERLPTKAPPRGACRRATATATLRPRPAPARTRPALQIKRPLACPRGVPTAAGCAPRRAAPRITAHGCRPCPPAACAARARPQLTTHNPPIPARPPT